MPTRTLHDLVTPALLIDGSDLESNLRAMSQALPGPRLRPHVKAHKCSALAARQRSYGHHAFTCATAREAEVMAAAGFSDDLLVANETADATRLGRLDARITLVVDSEATIVAAQRGGVREVLIDVDVGMGRCGCTPDAAGRLAEVARRRGLEVRGVMGYEGHVMTLPDRKARGRECASAMALLRIAHDDVGGEVVSAGGTGVYDLNAAATEIQAGSYALMDTVYERLGLPFRPALSVLATVVSVSGGRAVADCGAKALGMDHGPPAIEGAEVRRVSDEQIVFTTATPPQVGDRIRVRPAHVDPTVSQHAVMHVVDGERVLDSWTIDMRGW